CAFFLAFGHFFLKKPLARRMPTDPIKSVHAQGQNNSFAYCRQTRQDGIITFFHIPENQIRRQP
ncbi:TPA: hypothetical protein ACFNMI_002315, partial [Neisseria bacilliformis]